MEQTLEDLPTGMVTYPKSDCINRDFDKDLELYRKMKNKRRQESSEKQPYFFCVCYFKI